jgi:hypothetical protein
MEKKTYSLTIIGKDVKKRNNFLHSYVNKKKYEKKDKIPTEFWNYSESIIIKDEKITFEMIDGGGEDLDNSSLRYSLLKITDLLVILYDISLDSTNDIEQVRKYFFNKNEKV